MKTFLTLFTAALSVLGYSQDYNFKPNWVTKVIGKEVVSGVNPKKAVKTKKETITTIDIQ